VIVVISDSITQVKPPVVWPINPSGSHRCCILLKSVLNVYILEDKDRYSKSRNHERTNKIKGEKTGILLMRKEIQHRQVKSYVLHIILLPVIK